MSSLKLNYDDITILPERVTDICSRSQCNPYDEDGYLPIFASCMSSVVSIENTPWFNAAKIRTVIPRSYSVETRLDYLRHNKNNANFVAFSLAEVREIFIDKKSVIFDQPVKICIDLANGHMRCLLDTVEELKAMYGDKIIIMTGNIANPETYYDYELAGVDYCRVSIGTGNVCSTSSNTAIHYPVFSLLEAIYRIKKNRDCECKIVADGGIHGFRDIQKALIFADYVMIGSLFNKAIESAGKTTYGTFYWNIRGKKIVRPITTLLFYGREIPKKDYWRAMKKVKQGKLTVWKELFGMSSKIAQALINKANSQETKKLKTSEGLLKYQKVEYDLEGWAENETDFLRSAMSYTNSLTLKDYHNSQWVQISKIAYNN